MVKKVLKILYISFGVIIAFLVYMIGYQTNVSNHILKMTTEAIESGDYSNIAMIHGGCFDKKNVIEDNSDALDIAIYPTAHLSKFEYYENVEEQKVKVESTYENGYYIYLIDINFSHKGYLNNGVNINDAGVKFIDGNASYKYNFIVSESINSDEHIATTQSREDVYLASRNLIETYNNWGFTCINLTEGMLKTMGLSGVNKIEIYNDINEVVASFDVTLDFSQKFFSDVKPLVDNYNEYLEVVTTNEDNDDAIENAEAKFNRFYLGENGDGTTGFYKEFLEMDEKYSFRYDDKELEPGKLVWQTIGTLVLYLVTVTALYLLLFHFNQLKGLFTRNRGGHYRVNPASENAAKAAAQRRESINAKVKPAEEEKVVEEIIAVDSPVENETADVVEAEIVEETPVENEATAAPENNE